MKNFISKLSVVAFLALLFCCQLNGNNPYSSSPKQITVAAASPKYVEVPGFSTILDSNNVSGSVLIFDPAENTYWGNNFERTEKGFLPASTFKIANSIIALETGVVNDSTFIFKWDGQKKRLPQWEADLTLKQAFQVSCVDCFQQVARNIGYTRMKDYLSKFNYGHMVLDETSIDKFWLEGDSKISQKEQIDFLTKIYYEKLPVSAYTYKSIKNIMLLEDDKEYKLSGKTGWAIRNGNNIGWFVGYLEVNNKVYFVATNIEPRENFTMEKFPIVRKQITMKAFKQLKIID